jgi:VanZ family protein
MALMKHWIRWSGALVYTALLTLLLVQSSGHPVVGPAAPPGKASPARELLLTSGHIIGFSLLVVIWWWTLRHAWGERRALLMSLVISFLLGITTEIAQTLVPDRSSSWDDLAVNVLVSLAAALLIVRWRRRFTPSKTN